MPTCNLILSQAVEPHFHLLCYLNYNSNWISKRPGISKVWKVWFDKIPNSDSANTKDVQFTAVINQAVLPSKKVRVISKPSKKRQSIRYNELRFESYDMSHIKWGLVSNLAVVSHSSIVFDLKLWAIFPVVLMDLKLLFKNGQARFQIASDWIMNSPMKVHQFENGLSVASLFVRYRAGICCWWICQLWEYCAICRSDFGIFIATMSNSSLWTIR